MPGTALGTGTSKKDRMGTLPYMGQTHKQMELRWEPKLSGPRGRLSDEEEFVHP